MEIVTDLANTSLLCNQPSQKNKLDYHVEALVISDSPPLQASIIGFIQDPCLSRTNVKPTAYVNVFANN